MASVGVGVTTYNRPDMLKKCLEHIKKHTFNDNVTIYVADDSNERKGVAYRKNECLRALKDCEHIFLFDDDCYPIRDGWVEFFIQGARDEHVMFLNDKLHNYYMNSTLDPNFRCYRDCGGVFMYISKSALDYVGAFNEKFDFWGFEHAEWSMRYADGNRIFMMLEGTENYIYAEDYSNPNHKSSITNEEKKLLFRKNFPKFAKGIDKIYIPL